ncbi:hypothetical protein D9758_015788 [Tetrapyrgos nigripes]|uniref:Uncharacterized protein n=1 Tax=Tetrapyrgos nigripes TaxID=182062 RepID=A0A8H5C3G0_9AGAR|nr:hypothetical protein D9758_015788 [Tetrapyrgos nigripes]
MATNTNTSTLQKFASACANGNLKEVQSILAGFTATRSTLHDHPLQHGLIVAAENGHDEIVKYLLGNGFRYLLSEDIFQAMINSGWDINQSAGHTGDALSHAVGADRTKLVKWLLEHGGNPNENYRSEPWTCLDLGVIHASTGTVELLLKHGANIQNTNSLLLACFYGRVEMINLLLEYGVDINEIPDNELTSDRDRARGLGNALHLAAREDREEWCKFF